MNRLKLIIKDDIIGFLFLLFVVGVGFIWLGDGYGLIHVSGDGEISGTVLWLTSLAIIWYAYETYQLKLITSEQAEIQEVIMQNEFLPILEPVSGKGNGAMLRNGRFIDFHMRNLGKGPAKNIELHIGNLNVPLDWTLAGGEHEAIILSQMVKREVAELLKTVPVKVRMRITYQDIYKRKFQTEHIVFEREKQGSGYALKHGTWDFKRVRR